MNYNDIHHFDYVTLDVLNNGQTEVQVIGKELPNILIILLNEHQRKVPVECVLTHKTNYLTLNQGDKISITAGNLKEYQTQVLDVYYNGIVITYFNLDVVKLESLFIEASDIKQLKKLQK